MQSIIDGGYCVGCGACASIPDSPFQIRMDEKGCFQAEINSASNGLDSAQEAAALEVCPFSGQGPNEDAIGRELFGEDNESREHDRIGFHRATYAGHVNEGGYRDRGSSGGMGSWVLTELMRRDKIDAVIHVGAVSPEENGRLFEFKISRSIEEVNERAKSRYYPVELSQVIREVFERPGRYALVGLPCFIKAFRLLARQNPVLNERILYTLAIVCGHLKSSRFAELFSWQCGIEPGDLEAIDFRKKIETQPASHYGIEVKGSSDGNEVVDCKTNVDFYGSNWGHGLFKYSACDYCDDVLGETADVVVGDAWLPGYVEDSKGTNVVVVRDARIYEMIEAGITENRLSLDSIDADTVAASQDAGLRHRREGLQYRLLLKDQENSWRPPKRVIAKEEHLTERQKTIYKLRVELAAYSHEAFIKAIAAGSFKKFTQLMKPLQDKYDSLYAAPFLIRVKRRLGRLVKSFLPAGPKK